MRILYRNICFLIILVLAITAGTIVFIQTQELPQQSISSERTLTITVAEGDHWNSYIRILFFLKRAKTPQMAFWLEDTSGKFVATIYVTRRTAVQDWRAMPFQDDIPSRPSSLPVWSHKHVNVGIHNIESCSHCHDRIKSADKSIDGDPILDAFTGATPEHGFSRQWRIPDDIKPGEYILRAEINHSFDYNEIYKEGLPDDDENANDVSGQPSLVYAGKLTIADAPTSCTLLPVGYGHPSGANGRIYPLDQSITTAQEIVSAITAQTTAHSHE